jgi:hypothetical protein
MLNSVANRNYLSRPYFLSFLSLLLFTACSSLQSSTLANRAEQLVEEGRYDQAIESYRSHIERRLAASDRPEWENPYFYLLRVTDIELMNSRPNEALKACSEAAANGVERGLISDRYRAIAAWHIDHKELQRAFDILKTHRELDPLLFDAMLDRVGRALPP